MGGKEVPEDWIPDGEVTLGHTMDEKIQQEQFKAYDSLLEYFRDIIESSGLEFQEAFKGYRGKTFLYQRKGLVLAVSDDEGLGIDYLEFEQEPDTETVKEKLEQTGGQNLSGVKNNYHKNLYGEEAYDEINKILEMLGK